MGEPLSDESGSGGEAPELSIVIPIYDEQAILAESVHDLCERLDALALRYEILLAENGSRDETPAVAADLAASRPEIRTFSYPEPNYGGALREAIYRARGRFVVCEEIDLCDVDFHVRALGVLRTRDVDMVIGSKAMRGANDTRPLGRRVATRVYNAVLRVTLGFRGTDTHGLKAFARESLVPVVASCVVEHDVFASELVIRAQRMGLRVVEIPVEVREKRAPSVRLARRVPRVLGNLARLMLSIHGRSSAPSASELDAEPPAPGVSGSGRTE